jgi:hypothetical protein
MPDEIKQGDYVRLLDDMPEGIPPTTLFRVVVVNDEGSNPGKVIGLQCEERWPMLHSCDDAVDDKRGWWSRPEHLEKVEV